MRSRIRGSYNNAGVILSKMDQQLLSLQAFASLQMAAGRATPHQYRRQTLMWQQQLQQILPQVKVVLRAENSTPVR